MASLRSGHYIGPLLSAVEAAPRLDAVAPSRLDAVAPAVVVVVAASLEEIVAIVGTMAQDGATSQPRTVNPALAHSMPMPRHRLALDVAACHWSSHMPLF